MIENEESNFSIITDPWYDGLAFNKGWSLLFKNPKKQVEKLAQNQNTFLYPMNILIIFQFRFLKSTLKF